MDHGELNHSFGLLRDDFEFAIEATRECQPREGTFNDPALWQNNAYPVDAQERYE